MIGHTTKLPHKVLIHIYYINLTIPLDKSFHGANQEEPAHLSITPEEMETLQKSEVIQKDLIKCHYEVLAAKENLRTLNY